MLNLFEKRQSYYFFWNNRVTPLLPVLLQHKFTFIFFFQMFPVGWELWELEARDCPKFLVFGTETKTKLPAEFPGS